MWITMSDLEKAFYKWRKINEIEKILKEHGKDHERDRKELIKARLMAFFRCKDAKKSLYLSLVLSKFK